MIQDVELFIALAEIAGVFVGFGALISLTRKNSIEFSQLGRIRAVVSIGLAIIVAALIPIGLSLYNIGDHNLWLISSIIFLAIIWIMNISSLRKSEYRKLATSQVHEYPIFSIFFWILLEAPIHILLILTVIGPFPELKSAFYLSAILFHLFEAALILVQIVNYQMGISKNPKEQEETHVFVH